MVDDPTSNTSVGFCEFEAVRTVAGDVEQRSTSVLSTSSNYLGQQVASSQTQNVRTSNSFVFNIKDYIGRYLNLDQYLIYIDVGNSFQVDDILMVGIKFEHHEFFIGGSEFQIPS